MAFAHVICVLAWIIVSPASPNVSGGTREVSCRASSVILDDWIHILSWFTFKFRVHMLDNVMYIISRMNDGQIFPKLIQHGDWLWSLLVSRFTLCALCTLFAISDNRSQPQAVQNTIHFKYKARNRFIHTCYIIQHAVRNFCRVKFDLNCVRMFRWVHAGDELNTFTALRQTHVPLESGALWRQLQSALLNSWCMHIWIYKCLLLLHFQNSTWN